MKSQSRLLVLSILCALAAPAHAQSIDPDCSTNPLVSARLELSWAEVPGGDSVSSSSSSAVTLLVQNAGAETYEFALVGRMLAGGERTSLPLASGTIFPGAVQTIGVPLDGFGIDVSALEFSGTLFVEATAHAVGALVDRAYSPVLHFHRESGSAPTTWLYGPDARRAYFHSGDLLYQVYPSEVPDNVLGVFDGGAGDGHEWEDHGPARSPRSITTQVASNESWEFCMRWIYQSVDSGFGEDHYTSGYLMKARGMKVKVDHANWAQPKWFTASDDNGCFSFEADENTGFVVTAFAEASLGENGGITIRSFDEIDQAVANDPDSVKQWTFVANPGGEPRRVYYQNEPGPHSDLMAFGSFCFHWVDHQTQPRLAGPLDLQLVRESGSCAGSCQSMLQVRIQPGTEKRKFLVGHEVGHWLHRWWTNNQLGLFVNSYHANSGDAPCAFVGVGNHAMRSKEYATGAFVEGFAHYLSALAWNDHGQKDGWFKYYKEVDAPAYADLAADEWRVDLEGAGQNPAGGVSAWMENMCSVHDGHSVEMDWLRFYWDYRTDGPKWVRPSHHDLFEHILYTQDVNPWADSFGAYDRLQESIHDPGLGQTLFQERWDQLSIANGIAH